MYKLDAISALLTFENLYLDREADFDVFIQSSTTSRPQLHVISEPEVFLLDCIPNIPLSPSPYQLPHRTSLEVLPLPGEESRRISRISLGTDIFKPP